MGILHAVLCQSGLAINDRESLAVLDRGAAAAVSAMCVVAVIVAIVVAPVVRAMYRQRVMRLMKFEEINAGTFETATFSFAAGSNSLSERSRLPDVDKSDVIAGAGLRQRRIVRGTVLALVVFMLGALVVARILGGTWADGGAMFVTAGLLAAGPLFVNVRPYGSQRTTLLTLSMLTIAFLAAEMLFSSQESSDTDRFDVFLGMVAVLALVALLMHRTLRPLVLPLATIVCAPLLALLTPLFVGIFVADCESTFGVLGNMNIILAGLVGAPLLAFAVMLAFRALDLLAEWQTRGVVNDISMVGAFAVFLTALLLTWSLYEDLDSQPSLAILLVPCLWAATPCLAYFKATALHVPGTQMGHALLVLRVFDKTGRAPRLLDRLQTQWRLIGPVWQIGGPDLASMNVSLFENTMFLAGRLHELFLSGAVPVGQLERRLRRLPGQDGRWGIDEVFCFNTAWRRTVDHLMTMSDAILIDVRGVTPDRAGIRDELMLLARSDRLARTLAIGDERTDWAYVDQVVHENAGDCSYPIRRATETRGGEREYLAALVNIAIGSRRGYHTGDH
jgi:hypothetical protein